MSFYLISLPTFGAPYILKKFPNSKKNSDEVMETIQKNVKGYFEVIDRKSFIIHPMFMENDNRWTIANRLLLRPQTQVYVNEDGAYSAVPNGATILKQRHPSGCPHVSGEICIKVSEDSMKKANINPDCITLIREVDEYDDEDDEDEDYLKLKQECDKNGWDFYASAGQIYKTKA
jgi:hypothetical protein